MRFKHEFFRRAGAVFFFISATVLLFSCEKQKEDMSGLFLLLGGVQPSVVSSQSVVSNYAQYIVVPIYKDLADSGAALDQAVTDLKNVYDNGSSTKEQKEAAVLAARNAWKDARIYWEYSEAFLFGPVDTNGYDPALDSWPLDKNALDTAVASGSTILDQDETKGFHAAEYLLFEVGDDDAGGDTVEAVAAALTSNKIKYLKAVTGEIKSVTAALYNEWDVDPDFKQNFLKIGTSASRYTSLTGALEEMAVGMQTIINEVHTGKLEPVETGDVSTVESRHSWNSRADFANNIKGVQWVWKGDYTNRSGTVHTGPGLYELIQSKNPDLAAKVDNAIQTAYDAILAIPQPFRNHLSSAEARNAVAAMKTLADAVTNELIPYVNANLN